MVLHLNLRNLILISSSRKINTWLITLMLSIMPDQKEKNMGLAIAGITIIYKQFPLGGLNRADVFASMELTVYLAQLNLFRSLRASYGKPDSGEIVRAILMSGKLKGAYCGEMAALALNELSKVAGDTPIERVSLDNHQMLVIGRKADSDPENIETWGEDAVICDPWARKFYEASKFHLEQECGEKIAIIKSIRLESGSIEVDGDYLKGTPTIGF